MTRSHRKAGGAVAALLTLSLLGACGSDPEDEDPVAETTVEDAGTDDATETDERPTDDAAQTDDGAQASVTIEEAEQVALDAVGEGEVTWSGPEDDRGAAWEIEITRPDGSEVDVLVAADGTVVKIIPQLAEAEAAEPQPVATPSGTVTLAEAEQLALAAVGEGEVTWSGPEDDRGAAWEIEITRPDGSEVDVLVAADGSIVY